MEARSRRNAIKKVGVREKRRGFDLKFAEIDPALLIDASESLALTGEAGAGKTSLSRVLVDLALESGRRCIYFPCSRIDDKEDSLIDRIGDYLQSSKAISTEQDIDAILRNQHLIVLDGCDEAATFTTKRLAKEISRLHYPRVACVRFEAPHPLQLFVPLDLLPSIKIQQHRIKRKQARKIGEFSLNALAPIHPRDYERLARIEQNHEYAHIIHKLRREQEASTKRMILTSRTTTPLCLSRDFSHIEAMPFNDAQLDNFFRKWFTDDHAKYHKIISFLSETHHIKSICRTPMIATLVAAQEENGYDLPRSKTDIYHKRFDLLLDKWDRTRGVASRSRIAPADKLRILSRLAYETHKGNRTRFTTKGLENIWESGFSELYHDCGVDVLIWELQFSNNVIYRAARGEFSLGHLSYQEFLTAREIVNRQDPRYLLDKFKSNWWRQVLVFYAGISGTLERLFRLVQRRRPIARHNL